LRRLQRANRAERGVVEEDGADVLTTFNECRAIGRFQLPALPHQLISVKQPHDASVSTRYSLLSVVGTCTTGYRRNKSKAGNARRYHKCRIDSFSRYNLPNDNVSMSVVHLHHVLTVYSSMDHVTSNSPKAQRQTRWIKEAIWTRKTLIFMNRDAGY